MNLKQTVLLLAILLTNICAFAQQGTIKGTISDQKTGEALMFTNVLVLDTDPIIGAQTDLDGNYELSLDPGLSLIHI